MVTPLEENMAGDPQEISLRVANFTEVAGAQQPQVRFLSQVLDVDGRPHPSAEELEQAPVPAALPSDEQRPIRHALFARTLGCCFPSTVERKETPSDPSHQQVFFAGCARRSQAVDYIHLPQGSVSLTRAGHAGSAPGRRAFSRELQEQPR